MRIALTGDAIITRPLSVHHEDDFLALKRLLKSADVRLTNAEVLFHRYEHAPAHVPGGSYMAADPALIDELVWMGINAACTANNHAYDFGENGLVGNLRYLRKSSLRTYAGTGVNLGRARAPAYVETSKGRVAIIGVTMSGPQHMCAGHQWRDGRGRPGANMIRYSTKVVVDKEVFASLRRMRDELGLVGRGRLGEHLWFSDHSYRASAQEDSERRFYMSDLQSRYQYPVPNGYTFEVGDEFRRELVADGKDVEENLQRIDDARRMADFVIVSMHNHESGADDSLPSNLVVDFARRAIDAGADVFHGHGPHRDRGLEIYCGRPIFYSLGHFVVQNDTIEFMQRENLERQGLDAWESMPADFYDARVGREVEGELLGPAGLESYWRDIVGLVEFSGRDLVGVTLHPIDLGHGLPRSRRGRPVRARGDVARRVLEDFEGLSRVWGTSIELRNERGHVAL